MNISPWQRALTAAGITGERLRADYTVAAQTFARAYPWYYSIVRVALPAGWQPHFYAVSWLGIRSDELADDSARDSAAFHRWADQVRELLVTGRSGEPNSRAFRHTVETQGISHADVLTHLAGQAERLWTTDYVTEADHYDHVERVLHPAMRILLTICRASLDGWRSVLPPLLDAQQRLDDLMDVFSDLHNGRCTVPQTDLLAFGVTREDLAIPRDTPAVRALIAHRCAKARAAFHKAGQAAQHLSPQDALLLGTSDAIFEIFMDAIERRSAALDRNLLFYLRPSPASLLSASAQTLRARLAIS
jgi:phytoene synthase